MGPGLATTFFGLRASFKSRKERLGRWSGHLRTGRRLVVSNPGRNVWDALPGLGVCRSSWVSNPGRNVWDLHLRANSCYSLSCFKSRKERLGPPLRCRRSSTRGVFQIPEGTFGTRARPRRVRPGEASFKSRKERLGRSRSRPTTPRQRCFKSRKERLGPLLGRGFETRHF